MENIQFRPPDSKSSFAAQQQLDSFDLEDHASLDEGVVELRRAYNEEEERRKSLETKIGGLVAINGVVLSLLQTSSTGQSYTTLEAVVLSLFIISTVLCLWNILPKGYEKPFALKEYPSLTRKKLKNFQSEQYTRYFSSTKYNREYNDFRYTWFIVAFIITALAIILVGANAIQPFSC